MCKVSENVAATMTVPGGLMNVTPYSPVTVYVVEADPVTEDPNET